MKPLLSSDEIERRSGNRIRKKKMILASEGYVTEIDYFIALRNYINACNSETLADLIVLQRHYIYSGYSDPIRVIELTDEYIKAITTGIFTERLFTGVIIDSVIDSYEQMKEKTKELETAIKDVLSNNNLISENTINNLNEAISCVFDVLSSAFDIKQFEIIDIDLDYDESVDTICIIVDRDRTCRDEKKYKDFILECEKRNYVPYVSNPKFELWIAFHCDIEKYIGDLKNIKTCSSTIKKILEENEIHDKHINCQSLMERISNAVSNSKKFCTDIEKLEDEIGTNLSLLIEILLPALTRRE